MRSIFDQYSQYENQLTHALASCLNEDQRLLRSFIKWVTGENRITKELVVHQQSVPWLTEVTEAEAEARGLPDAWISSEDGWALIVECKIAAHATADQLIRHRQTAHRHGWANPVVLLLDAKSTTRRLPEKVLARRWPEVYAWASQHANESKWAQRLKDYMETLEARLIAEGYLVDGALTMFSGIPFSRKNPWNYVESKRLIKLAMEDLRKRRPLEKQLKAKLSGDGRPAITGKGGFGVWDFIPLSTARGDRSFTNSPHLTLSIQDKRTLVTVTVPNGIKTEYRRNLLRDGLDGFIETIRQVNEELALVIRRDPGAAPWVVMVQRRYPAMNTEPIVDANLEFDLRSAFPSKTHRLPVRTQPQWLEAAYQALTNKRSNLQFSIGTAFPYGRSKYVNQSGFLQRAEETWLACKPLLKAMGAI